MDINYLLQREQIERVRAERTTSAAARAAHQEMADRYRDMVEGQRRSLLEAAGVSPDSLPAL
jgi:hypothetical protein